MSAPVYGLQYPVYPKIERVSSPPWRMLKNTSRHSRNRMALDASDSARNEESSWPGCQIMDTVMWVFRPRSRFWLFPHSPAGSQSQARIRRWRRLTGKRGPHPASTKQGGGPVRGRGGSNGTASFPTDLRTTKTKVWPTGADLSSLLLATLRSGRGHRHYGRGEPTERCRSRQFPRRLCRQAVSRSAWRWNLLGTMTLGRPRSGTPDRPIRQALPRES